MARARHLPLYAATFKYVRGIYQIKTKLPKLVKYDLGQESSASAIKLLKLVVIENSSKEKGPVLNHLLIEIEMQ